MQQHTDICDGGEKVAIDTLCSIFLEDSTSAQTQSRLETRSYLATMDDIRQTIASTGENVDMMKSLKFACLWYALGCKILRSAHTLTFLPAPRFMVTPHMTHTCWKLEALVAIHEACKQVDRCCMKTYYPARLSPSVLLGSEMKPVVECPLLLVRLCIALVYWARFSLLPHCAALAPRLPSVIALSEDELIDRLRSDAYILCLLSTPLPESQANNVAFLKTLRPLAKISPRATVVFVCFSIRYHRFRREVEEERSMMERLPAALRQHCDEWRRNCGTEGTHAIDQWLRHQEEFCSKQVEALQNCRSTGMIAPGPVLLKYTDLPHYMGHDVLQYVNSKGENILIDLSMDLNKCKWPRFDLWSK